MLTLEEMKANRKLWVEALRSGKYKQVEGKLKDPSGAMCCLGVLSEIAGCTWTPAENIEEFYVSGNYGSAAASESVMAFVGLQDDNGTFDNTSLTDYNDNGYNFTEIADIIESEPPGLFVQSVEAAS